MRLKRILKVFLIIFLLSCYQVSLKSVFAQELPKLVISPSNFSKITVFVPDFKGDIPSVKKLSSLFRRVLNYHLFVLATPFKPISPSPTSYEVNGTFYEKANTLVLKATLISLAEEQAIKKYIIKGDPKYPYLLVYYLCDKVIKDISGYPGVAFTKIAFVKRGVLGDRLYIADFAKANPRCIDKAPLILFPQFSWEGDKIAYLVYEKGGYQLRIFNFLTLKRHTYQIKGLASTPVWVPGGKKLYLTLTNKKGVGIYLFDLKTKKLTPVLTGKGVYQASSVSKDGRYLAYVYDLGGDKPKVFVMDLKTRKKIRLSGIRGYNTSPKFSPKGDILVYLCRRGGFTFLKEVNLKTGETSSIILPLFIKTFCFSPHGNYIMGYGEGYSGTGIYLIHLDSKLFFLYLRGKSFLYPAWSRL
ncbi:MAG: hypothetical protein GXO57_00275 [Thermodesulfobacteria bacterium]|nr:hypothetical protein [Thermodesulfobacteriota bacterium]